MFVPRSCRDRTRDPVLIRRRVREPGPGQAVPSEFSPGVAGRFSAASGVLAVKDLAAREEAKVAVAEVAEYLVQKARNPKLETRIKPE